MQATAAPMDVAIDASSKCNYNCEEWRSVFVRFVMMGVRSDAFKVLVQFVIFVKLISKTDLLSKSQKRGCTSGIGILCGFPCLFLFCCFALLCFCFALLLLCFALLCFGLTWLGLA